jgi:hypothetical protein
MAYRNYSTARSHIVDATGGGDFLTIQSAVTAAVAGDTVFVRPGTYAESVTFKPGVNVTAFDTDGVSKSVFLQGNSIISAAGTYYISNIAIDTTTSSYGLNITGSNQCTVYFNRCLFPGDGPTSSLGFTNTNAATEVTITASVLLQPLDSPFSFPSDGSFTGTVNLISCQVIDTVGSGLVIIGAQFNVYNCFPCISLDIRESASGTLQNSLIDVSGFSIGRQAFSSDSVNFSVVNCTIIGYSGITPVLFNSPANNTIIGTSVNFAGAPYAIQVAPGANLNYAFITFTGTTTNTGGGGTFNALPTL